MKFIKKIELKNFQSHKYSCLELDPYLNVIVGPSDSGKSSIIRALKWALFNEPSGDFFIREGETEVSVKLFFSDGSKVTRFRSRSKNSYTIEYSNGEELILNGFGVNVPKEVEEITEVSRVPFDQNTREIINIADQLEGPFLLSEKNSTKAFVIGGLAGVDIVDDSISDLLKELRNLNIEDKRLDTNIGEIDEQLKEFDKLEDMKALFKEVESLYKTIKDKEDRLKELKSYLISYRELEFNKNEINKSLSGLKNIDKLNSLYLKLYENVNLFKGYRLLNTNMTNINKEMLYTENILKSFKDLEKLIEIKDEVSEKLDIYSSIYNVNKRYRSLLKDKDNIDKYLLKLKKLNEIDSLNNELTIKNSLYEKLNRYDQVYREIIRRKTIGLEYIDKFNNVDKVIVNFNSLGDYIITYGKMMNIRELYIKNMEEKNKIDKLLDEYNAMILSKSNEYKDVLLEAKVCPTCFSKINDNIIDNIVKELNK